MAKKPKPKTVTETLRGQAPAVVNQLLNRIYSGEMSDGDLIKATDLILTRAFGKAPQQISMDINKRVEVDVRVMHLDALKDVAAARIAKHEDKRTLEHQPAPPAPTFERPAINNSVKKDRAA